MAMMGYLSCSSYAFGRFVRVAVHTGPSAVYGTEQDSIPTKIDEPTHYIIGVIYDTTLLNPAFGSLGPRLSTETQVELFSPDYISEKGVLVHVTMLGMLEQLVLPDGASRFNVAHGVPSLALALGSSVETMADEDVRLFHFFRDQESDESQMEYVHMGYLPHLIAQKNSLLMMVALRILDQLFSLFPQNILLLSIIKRNLAWRLMIESTG